MVSLCKYNQEPGLQVTDGQINWSFGHILTNIVKSRQL